MSAKSQRNRAEVFASGGVYFTTPAWAAFQKAMQMLQDANALGWLAHDADIRKQIAETAVSLLCLRMNTHSDNAKVAVDAMRGMAGSRCEVTEADFERLRCRCCACCHEYAFG